MPADSKKYFFASDFHLGQDGVLSSKDREKLIVKWLETIEPEIKKLFLLGDVFDYWFEYGEVVPRGFSLFLAKLADMRNSGIPIEMWTGNHDMWMFDYFPLEYGIPLHRKPQHLELFEKQFFIGHGDGLGPGDVGYKMIKKIFSNSLCQWAFARIHPNTALKIMRTFSQASRESVEPKFSSREKERLISFCDTYIQSHDVDYLVFGHRHIPFDVVLSDGKSKYFGIGDWLFHQSYGMFDEDGFVIKYFESQDKTVVLNRPPGKT